MTRTTLSSLAKLGTDFLLEQEQLVSMQDRRPWGFWGRIPAVLVIFVTTLPLILALKSSTATRCHALLHARNQFPHIPAFNPPLSRSINVPWASYWLCKPLKSPFGLHMTSLGEEKSDLVETVGGDQGAQGHSRSDLADVRQTLCLCSVEFFSGTGSS